jgi:hypothetical protein
MKRAFAFSFTLVAASLAIPVIATDAWAVQFSTIDPAYVQEIYTGPLVGGPGMAWTSSNQLLTRNGSDILEYSLTQNTTHQGTSLHGTTATHTISGLSTSGYGMTNGLDGYIYTVTGGGLQRFDPANWAAPAQSLAGTVGGAGYGVTTLPDGRIAYSDGGSNSNVYVYDPVGGSNTPIYSASFLIDGMVSGPAGNIALAGQSNSSITILTSSGAFVNSFATPHFPDGLAFSSGATSSTLYSNNNDGTISRYVLGPGYTGSPVITDIATGSGAYGDLASVGPDCAFYVSQFENGGYHGSTPGVGTNWDNAVTNSEPSIIRIGGALLPDGTSVCEFYSPLDHNVPEPATLLLMTIGLALISLVRARARRLTPRQ